jgi:hypothetical protein
MIQASTARTEAPGSASSTVEVIPQESTSNRQKAKCLLLRVGTCFLAFQDDVQWENRFNGFATARTC